MNYQSIPLIGSALLLSTLSANGQKKNTQPNILFILCDDMGYGDLGCYGQPFIRTPHIDAMAGEGMRFTQAYAGSPVSAPSRASFMTGQHSGHCEVRGNKEYWKNAPIVEYGQNKEYSIVGQHPYDPDHFYDYANTHTSFYIHDIQYLSACYGLDAWAEPSYWYLYKYALSVPAIPDFAYNLTRIIRSIYGKNKKVLALDLDNTLWGGVIGDDGQEGIEIGHETSMGQAYEELQDIGINF